MEEILITTYIVVVILNIVLTVTLRIIDGDKISILQLLGVLIIILIPGVNVIFAVFLLDELEITEFLKKPII